MSAPLIWLHEEALRMDHPVFQAAPAGTRSVFIWDDAHFQQLPYSLKRLVFLYETLCEMPVDILRGETLHVLQQYAPSVVYVPATTDPQRAAMLQHISQHLPLQIVAEEPFVTFKKPIDAKRFFQYWNKAEKTAFLHNGGVEGAAHAR
jgi:hypothetical protein